jgi:superfamily II DNA helicase RecQ
MGGKKGGNSAPPQIVLPGPSEEEKKIQQQQLELMQKQLEYMDVYFQDSQADRQGMQDALTRLTTGRDLTAEERGLVDQMGTQYQDMLMRGITDGIVGEQLDRTRQASIADLVERGVLNGTTGQRVIGDIERERSRLIKDAQSEAALQRLNLERDFRKDATNAELARAQLLSGVSGNLAAMANSASGTADSIASGVANRMRDERFQQSNIAAQNAQMQYMHRMNQPKRSGAGIGSMIGAGLGALAAPFTGGLSLAGGLALGSTLGGAAGSFF